MQRKVLIMKRFYLNALLFALVLTIVLIFFDYLSMREPTRTFLAEITDSTEYIAQDRGPDEIKPYLERTHYPDGTTKLIIGDSVCRQLFSHLQSTNTHIAMLGSNAGLTVAGQYIIAKEYLEHHPDTTDVFLLMLPKSLVRTFDTNWGYLYVVMPFVETDTLKYLDQETIDCLGVVYGKPFLNPAVVQFIDRSAINRKLYLNLLKEHSDGYVPSNAFEIADQYVYKIYEMCKEKNVAFHLYPCPVSEASADKVHALRSDFEKSKIREISPDYLDMVTYYPEEESKDGTHFTGKYANDNHYDQLIKDIYNGTELYDMLSFSVD